MGGTGEVTVFNLEFIFDRGMDMNGTIVAELKFVKPNLTGNIDVYHKDDNDNTNKLCTITPDDFGKFGYKQIDDTQALISTHSSNKHFRSDAFYTAFITTLLAFAFAATGTGVGGALYHKGEFNFTGKSSFVSSVWLTDIVSAFFAFVTLCLLGYGLAAKPAGGYKKI